MNDSKELLPHIQRENDGRPLDAKEELVRRALVLRHEVEKFLYILPYHDAVLTNLQIQIIHLQDNIMLLKASDVAAKLDNINQQLATYRSASE